MNCPVCGGRLTARCCHGCRLPFSEEELLPNGQPAAFTSDSVREHLFFPRRHDWPTQLRTWAGPEGPNETSL